MRTPVFTIDRTKLDGLAELAETIESHLRDGKIVHVVDGNWPAGERLRYTLQWTRDACRVFDGHGRSLGVFADLEALAQYAETMTA